MSAQRDDDALPATPWEFLPGDEGREPTDPPAEEAAMHIDPVGPLWADEFASEPDGVVVHYLADEHAEVPDRSLPRRHHDETPCVDALLIRQHYVEGPG